MPLTTFLSADEAATQSDGDIQPLLDELTRATGQRWVVLTRAYLPHWWSRTPTPHYCLHVPLGRNEYEVVTFGQHGLLSDTWAPKHLVLAYLRGALAGIAGRQEEG